MCLIIPCTAGSPVPPVHESLSNNRIFIRSIRKVYPNANPDQVWVDLCKNDATAFRIVKAFLKFYVVSSKQEWLTLGPKEHVIERAVKSARSLNAFWKALIAAADTEVLAPLRQKSTDNYQLVLKHPKNYPGSADEGPMSKISHWIYHEGAEEMGLATVPEYTTVEMTARDIGVILRTLWLFADWIPMTPFQCVIFHALIILFSLGFRQGMITGMKFQDVAVAMVRDLVDPTRRRLATMYTIWRNKLRRDALEHKKGKKYVVNSFWHPSPG